MEKMLKDKLDNWIAFSNTIQTIYLKLIKLEQANLTDSEEYKTLKYVLPDALRFEKKAMEELNINPNNVRFIKSIIDEDTDSLFENVCLELSDDIARLRRSNMLDEYLLARNNFADTMKERNLAEIMAKRQYIAEVENIKYATDFVYIIKSNFIKVVDEEIKKTKDKKLRDYLISLKYRVIASNPRYEDNYTYFNYHALPYMQLNTFFFDFDKEIEEEYKKMNRSNVKTLFIDELVNMFCFTNEMLKDEESLREFIRIKLFNKARLTAILELKYMDSIRDKTMLMIPSNPNNSEAVEAYMDTLASIYDLIKEKDQQKKHL